MLGANIESYTNIFHHEKEVPFYKDYDKAPYPSWMIKSHETQILELPELNLGLENGTLDSRFILNPSLLGKTCEICAS